MQYSSRSDSRRAVSRQSSLFLTSVQKSIGSVLMATGLITLASTAVKPLEMVQAAETPVALRQAQVSTAAIASEQPLQDGVYLYGQSPAPEQIGSAYMVFRVNDRQVVGAFYMPSSSFDCFYGSLQPNQLALTVVDSYEQTEHPYAVALQPGSNVASADGSIAPLQLAGYHRISAVSENDRRILATCLADNPGQE